MSDKTWKDRLHKEVAYSHEHYQTALDATIGSFKRQEEVDLSTHRQLLYDAFDNSVGKTSTDFIEPKEGYARKLMTVLEGAKEGETELSPENALNLFRDTLAVNLVVAKNRSLSRNI